MLSLIFLGPPPTLKTVPINDSRSEISAQYPTYRGTAGAALATKLARRFVDEMILEFRAQVKDFAPAADTKTGLTVRVLPGRNDPAVTSLALEGLSNWGGPYPQELARGITVVVVKGRASRMTNVSELFRPGTPWKKWVIAALERKRAKNGAPALQKSDVPDNLGLEDWSLTRTALRFHFPKGTFGPAVLGNESVSVPASTFRAALRPTYKRLF